MNHSKITVSLALVTTLLTTGYSSPARGQELVLKSDNQKLAKTFNWAVEKAQTFTMTGKTAKANSGEDGPTIGYKESISCIPSYWAGYANRTAFYCRDFSRQSLGAHLVGLDEENFSMYEAFAKHCTEDKQWYTWWALNFDGSVYTLDAPNPPGEKPYPGYPEDFKNPKGERFVREVPANFNLIFNAYKCYLWTGDKRYLTNPFMKNFREKSMNEFFTIHDKDKNGIPEGQGDIWVGSASYNERDLHPKEAGDAVSLIYAARLAYAGFLEAAGEKQQASIEKEKAQKLYRYFNDEWSRMPGDSMHVSAIRQDGSKYNRFTKETTFLMPIYGITEPGKRNDQLLEYIKKEIGDGLGSPKAGPKAMTNIESYTYLPELFFAYNLVEDAYKFVNYITDRLNETHELGSQGPNSEFPEVAFTMISNLVEGMMGVQANAPQRTICSVPRLPSDTKYATVSNLKVGKQLFELTHRQNTFSELKYTEGKEKYKWEAAFYGKYPSLQVNGKAVKARLKKLNGLVVSFVQADVLPGTTVRVELPK